MQASRLAQLQTRHEMETAFAAEQEPPRGSTSDQPTESAVLALLQENGLSAREAALLYKDLYASKTSSSNAAGSQSPRPSPPQDQQQWQQQQARAAPQSSTASQPQAPLKNQQPQQKQQRSTAGGGSNPLGIIPLTSTGLPPRARQPRGGQPPSAPAAPRPPMAASAEANQGYSYSAGGCGDIPIRATGSRAASNQGLGGRDAGGRSTAGGSSQPRQQQQQPRQEADWDQWSASSDVPDDGSGNGLPTSAFESSIGAFAQQPRRAAVPPPSSSSGASRGGGRSGGGTAATDWGTAHVSNMDVGGCGSIPEWARQTNPPAASSGGGGGGRSSGGTAATDWGTAHVSNMDVGGCGSIPEWARQTNPPAASSGGGGGGRSGGGSAGSSAGGEWATAHVSNMDVGGCGSIPEWARQGQAPTRPGDPPPASPFQGMCAESVTPIPYNASADPFNRTSSPGGGAGSYFPPAGPPGGTGGGRPGLAAAAAGQSLGGCGSVPSDFSMWDKEDIWQDQGQQQQQRQQPPASPFQGMCAESVTPIPYNPQDDPFTRGSFAPPAPAAPTPPGQAARNGSSGRPRTAPPPPPQQQQQRGEALGSPEGAGSTGGSDGRAARAPHLGASSPFGAQAGNGSTSTSTSSSSNGGGAQGQLTLSQLSARLDRWRRVLPGVNPARLAAVDADFLYADVAVGLRALITLVAELPERDVMGMLDRVPKLLWADDLRGRLHTCLATLARLHPSRDVEIAKDIVAEHPELVFRMHYYTHVTLIDELPIEIQNIICSVLADQGIGSAFRYFRNRQTNYGAELTRGGQLDEPMM